MLCSPLRHPGRRNELCCAVLCPPCLSGIPGVTIGGIPGVAGAGAAVPAMIGGQPNPATRKAREIYVGNLAVVRREEGRGEERGGRETEVRRGRGEEGEGGWGFVRQR